ncbi:hypothetical protein F4809DRAFT_440439 [Biscogniauxia mediterranea]|nr:hypothetical protein F4809DRAFT_440439 [Biscogniauxia mediterranea]
MFPFCPRHADRDSILRRLPRLVCLPLCTCRPGPSLGPCQLSSPSETCMGASGLSSLGSAIPPFHPQVDQCLSKVFIWVDLSLDLFTLSSKVPSTTFIPSQSGDRQIGRLLRVLLSFFLNLSVLVYSVTQISEPLELPPRTSLPFIWYTSWTCFPYLAAIPPRHTRLRSPQSEKAFV